MIDKIPPHAPDIEEALLGAVLLEGSKFEEIKTMLPAEAFYIPDNMKVYQAMGEISKRGGKIDLLTVAQEPDIQATYVSGLTKNVASALHLKYHVTIVYEKWVARESIKIGSEMVDKSYEADEILDVLQDTRNAMDKRILHFLGLNTTGINIVEAANNSIDDYYTREKNIKEGKFIGIPTSLKQLNTKTGGLQKEQLVVLAGRTSMGKTSIAISFMITAATFKSKCAFFSLEMTSARLMDKVICSLADIDHSDFRGGKLTDVQKKKMDECMSIIENMNVTFNDEQLVSIEQVHALCRSIKDRKGLDIVFIDYLQLMRTTEKTGNREQEVSTISRKCKMMAVDLGVPVVLLSQLNRSLESRSDKRPMLSDLRESGAIEQDADIVLFCYRDSIYNEESPIDEGEVIVAKHREGGLGKCEFKHNKSMTRFEDFYRDENRTESIIDINMFSKESKEIPF